MKVYIYPTLPYNSQNLNPYLTDLGLGLSSLCDIVNHCKTTKSAIFDLFKNSFSADCYILNWIENTPYKKMGILQSIFFVMIIFPILRLRNISLIWVFHNFVSHQGSSFFSNYIFNLMLTHSNIIITHSKEAELFLNNNNKVKGRIFFSHHPIKKNDYKRTSKEIDLLIWGSIEPYKGIVEFLSYMNSFENDLKVYVIGKCKDSNYSNQIINLLNSNIRYENRIVPFEELKILIQKSKYVLFPYLPESVSSSGALIDTISLGGTPIGPSRGAFLDLSQEGLCYTYKEYSDILLILKNNVFLEENSVSKFIESNSWEAFSRKLYHFMQK